MQVEVIIHHGHIQLAHPVYLKPDAPICYSLEIPDDAVASDRDWVPKENDKENTSQYPKITQGTLQKRYKQILGKMAKVRQSVSIGDDFRTLQDALEERYDE